MPSKYSHEAFLPLAGWHAGQAREKELVEGLKRLAKAHGKTFKGLYGIDARGEISIIVDNGGNFGCGEYGDDLAALLSRHNPRTGIYPTKHMDARNGWCHMNHFDVARMLEEAGV